MQLSIFMKFARKITPPFLVDIYEVIFGFRGNYKRWDDAVMDSVGYDSDIILSKFLDSSLKVRRIPLHSKESNTHGRSWQDCFGSPHAKTTG